MRGAGGFQSLEIFDSGQSGGETLVACVEHERNLKCRVGGKRLNPVAGHDLMAAIIGIVVVYQDFHGKFRAREGVRAPCLPRAGAVE